VQFALVDLGSVRADYWLTAGPPQVRPAAAEADCGDGLVVWSDISEPTALDPIDGLVFHFLDGSCDVPTMAADVHSVLGVDPEVAASRIADSVARLEARGLLVSSEPPPLERDLLFPLGESP